MTVRALRSATHRIQRFAVEAAGLRAELERQKHPEIRRCLKRAVARQFFKLLEHNDRPVVEVLRA